MIKKLAHLVGFAPRTPPPPLAKGRKRAHVARRCQWTSFISKTICHGAWAERVHACSGGGVTVYLHHGHYHERVDELQAKYGAAGLAFGPNAGLAAYPSWLDTVVGPPRLHLIVLRSHRVVSTCLRRETWA